MVMALGWVEGLDFGKEVKPLSHCFTEHARSALFRVVRLPSQVDSFALARTLAGPGP